MPPRSPDRRRSSSHRMTVLLTDRRLTRLLPGPYRRRETRLAVRRPVRRATLRAPNISYLQMVARGRSGLSAGRRGCFQLVQVLGLLGRDQSDLYEVERADEPITDPEAPGTHDRVAQRHGPVVFDEDERCRGVVRDILKHI